MDISSFTNAELRALATRNLAECCDECRALLREQLEGEERQATGSQGDGYK